MKIECTVEEFKEIITPNADTSDVIIKKLFVDGNQIAEEKIRSHD